MPALDGHLFATEREGVDFERLLTERRGLSASTSSLEADLRLSAEIGSALLQQQTELQDKLVTADSAKHELLDRLALCVKENGQLEKRLERAVSNLDAAEAANRALLATHDEDRKKIARLSAEHVRGVGSDSKIKALAQEREDLRQELEAERRRASAADARARKATEKLAVTETRLERARKDADEHRHRASEKDQEALSKARALMTLAANAPRSPKLDGSEDDAPSEVIVLVQNLVAENDALRNETSELKDLLNAAQEEQSGMRSEIEGRSAFAPDDDGHAKSTMMSEALMMAESASERALSPAFGETTNGLANSWAPSTAYAHRRFSTMSNSSISDAGISPYAGVQYNTAGDASRLKRKRGSLRTVGPGRMHGRRTQSVDINALSSENEGDEAPAFPRPLMTRGSISHSRQQSRATLPPFSPLRDAFPNESTSGSEPVSPYAAATAPPPAPGPSGLTLSSPTRTRILSLSHPERADASVQTDVYVPAPASGLGAPISPSWNGQMTPDLSVSDVGSEHPVDSRTASLVLLIEHVTRLLTRIKAADVASLELRFKKQRLAGDVGHLSKATVREILAEIESLREHFRKILEQEHRVKSAASEHDSLVSKRDFVNLVKLLRDSFLELARLRGLVNRIQLEPALAVRLSELDKADSAEASLAPLPPTGLLAPLARFFAPSPATEAPVSSHQSAKVSAPPRQEATAAIAPTLVNVEFGKSGAIRRAVSIAPHAENGPGASARQATRGLNGIFAGGNLGVSRLASVAQLRNSTTVDDSPSGPVPGRLLERQLRPRGLSDSSVRTGFDGTIANPTHRALTPAKLALSTQSGQSGPAAPATSNGAADPTSREAILAALSARVNSFRTDAPPTAHEPPPTRPRPVLTASTPGQTIAIAGSVPPAEPLIKGESYGTSLSGGGLWNGLSAWASKAAFASPSLEERTLPVSHRRSDV